VRGRVPLNIPVMHLDHAGEERGKEGDKENGKKDYVFEGVISHKWQPCSTSNDTIVKYLLSQLWCCFQALEFV
jgi:hypothetical protein